MPIKNTHTRLTLTAVAATLPIGYHLIHLPMANILLYLINTTLPGLIWHFGDRLQTAAPSANGLTTTNLIAILFLMPAIALLSRASPFRQQNA